MNKTVKNCLRTAEDNQPEKNFKEKWAVATNILSFGDLYPKNLEELSAKININARNTKKNILTLKEKGLLRRVGPDKTGHWEVLK